MYSQLLKRQKDLTLTTNLEHDLEDLQGKIKKILRFHCFDKNQHSKPCH
jgi:hypothetical protein